MESLRRKIPSHTQGSTHPGLLLALPPKARSPKVRVNTPHPHLTLAPSCGPAQSASRHLRAPEAMPRAAPGRVSLETSRQVAGRKGRPAGGSITQARNSNEAEQDKS